MSAEKLRQAADVMRHDALLVDADRFLRAVADSLDHAAARAESKIRRGGKPEPVWSHERDALAVAEAYLNSPAPSS